MTALWNREGHYIIVLWFRFSVFFFMAALRSRCGHYILSCGFLFLLSFFLFFPRLFSAVVDWMPTILPHMVWP